MTKPRNIIRTLIGLTLVLSASSLSASGQVNVWTSMGPKIAISSLAIDPTSPGNIYAATRGGVFKSTDGGASWDNIGLSNATTLAIDFVNPNIIYVGTFSSDVVYHPGALFLFKSTDSGATWSNASSPTDFDIALLVMDPSSPTTLYAGSAAEAAGAGGIILWRSRDGGATWTGSFTGQVGLYPWGMAINPSDSKILYAPGDLWSNGGIPQVVDNGLFKSMDGGLSWVATGLTNTFVQAVAIDPFNPNVLYAGTTNWSNEHSPYRGLLKSTDAGASWFEINSGMNDALSAHSAIMAIVIDRDNPSTVYAATAGSGIFKTNNGGASWRPLNDGLTNLDVQSLALSPDHSHILYAGTSAGVFKIVDGVVSLTTNPNDDAQFFVRQQYLDFLNRGPDGSGWDFWMNEITSCGTDQQCIEAKRINVSGAFFLSIEFQQTGYLVYRLYKTSYGNLPDAPVPVTLNEFLPDTKELGQGVVVNQTGWEQSLENNKQKFTADFVQRTRFTSAYPTSLTPAEFVDKLFANAGVTPSMSDRADAINEFGSASTTSDPAARARALRRVAENSILAQQEFNRAFVLMQYFGYLRRNPNDAPEPTLDFQGYNFWLNKLNSFDGNFTNAEMVKAFITSTEYRQRFGAP
jgi:photosystem II stability/assembly factor-like uncharacterized protein